MNDKKFWQGQTHQEQGRNGPKVLIASLFLMGMFLAGGGGLVLPATPARNIGVAKCS